jgi:hypothetical protein
MTRILSILSLMAGVSACGIHVTSDPVKVEHSITLNVEGILDFCNKEFPSDDAEFKKCVSELADLFHVSLDA